VRLFWWNTVPNLGDVLTKMLLEHGGEQVEFAPVSSAEWVGIGSVLELFFDSRATIFGTGRAGPSAPPTNLRKARVLALRGTATRALTFSDAEVLGDPGLLVTDLQERWDGDYTAIVPHWQDVPRLRALYPDATIVDVTGDPKAALLVLAGAGRIISSSLHGVVFADAYGIPRCWDPSPTTQAKGFKFRDYGTVVGAFEPMEWHTADPGLIERVKGDLRGCLTSPSA